MGALKLVGLDSDILIYAARKRQPGDSDEQVALRNRTLALFAALDAEKSRIVIAMPALAEFLCGIPPARHGGVLAALRSRFVTQPLDVPSAARAAELWREHRELPPDQRIQRRLLKVDVLVVATARVAGASHFYSHDNDCRKLASKAGIVWP